VILRIAGSLVVMMTGVLTTFNLPADAQSTPTGRGDFNVTTGEIEALPNDRLGINGPEVRAVLRRLTAPVAQLHFRYLGPTAATKPLAKGR
jgi:hypothetical protein